MMNTKSLSYSRTTGVLSQCLAVVLVASSLMLFASRTNDAVADAPSLKPIDASPVVDWNAIAITTLVGDTSKSPVEAFLYMGFVQAAVYDAVVGTRGKFQPYSFAEKPPRPASAQAAAIAAAHHVLETYSPYAQANLDAAFATSIAELKEGKAVNNGIAYGHAVAQHFIDSRASDGRYAPVTFTKPPAPGVWRPTPPLNAPMAVPWMGGVTPLLVDSGAQFGDPGPPPSMTSSVYTRDFNEVKAKGAKVDSTRTDEQTSTAQFFSGNAAVQFNAALRDQVAVRHMHVVEAARLFAAVDTSIADTVISVWYSKLRYGFWRPITAINQAESDGNPDTKQDEAWEPFIATGTPPYPDYVSGYSGVVGAFTEGLSGALGTEDLNITLISTSAPGVTRHYDSAAALNQDVVDARVWLGIHFRFADTLGLEMGQQVASYGLENYFQHG